MSVDLTGKFIPLEWFREYEGQVRPIDDEDGVSNLPSREFPFRLSLDRFGHIYFIPLLKTPVCEGDDSNVRYNLAYSINDILEAASGNREKLKIITDAHAKLKQLYRNRHIMDDNFADAFLEVVVDKFVEDYEKANLPKYVTTATSLTADEAEELASKALTTA